MENINSLKYIKHNKSIDCTDVYTDEITKSIKTLKRFREVWMESPSNRNVELFQYADWDFYFYRFAIERQEKSTERLLTDILYRMLERYGVSLVPREQLINTPFSFVVCEQGKRIGYRFSDFFPDENVNNIIRRYRVNEAFILRTWKSGIADERIIRENKRYHEDGIRVRAILLEEFFGKYFNAEEYISFLKVIEQYLQDAREITGYKSIKFLSSMNLTTQKVFEEKLLADWNYQSYRYQIIDYENEKIKKYLYLSSATLSKDDLNKMVENYVYNKLFRTMTGSNEYAESFITSEWLYHSLKGKKNFDYTAIISGYLKSVEQLLYKIVMLNVDNKCKIAMNSDKDIRKRVKEKQITTYPCGNYTYIDFTSAQAKYMDSSMGTFEYFLRKNPHIFVCQELSRMVADMVSCFRAECRNGYFHTHNLKDENIVEKTRDNAIYLYFVLLAGCIIPKSKDIELGIISNDMFDDLCKEIRKFSHYNTAFIFEYIDGSKHKFIYDFLNNTAEYTDTGSEHYESLLFFEVDKFSIEAYEELDRGIKDSQKLYLTRNNLPNKIYGVYRNGELKEIVF